MRRGIPTLHSYYCYSIMFPSFTATILNQYPCFTWFLKARLRNSFSVLPSIALRITTKFAIICFDSRKRYWWSNSKTPSTWWMAENAIASVKENWSERYFLLSYLTLICHSLDWWRGMVDAWRGTISKVSKNYFRFT